MGILLKTDETEAPSDKGFWVLFAHVLMALIYTNFLTHFHYDSGSMFTGQVSMIISSHQCVMLHVALRGTIAFINLLPNSVITP